MSDKYFGVLCRSTYAADIRDAQSVFFDIFNRMATTVRSVDKTEVMYMDFPVQMSLSYIGRIYFPQSILLKNIFG